MIKIKNYFHKRRLLLLVVVAVLYGNTLKNGYSFDDSIVTEPSNLTATGLKAIPKIIHSYYIERGKGMQFDYRPIVKISFAIEHELFGVSPAVSHFINLLLYAIGLLLLYDVLKLLFSSYDDSLAFYATLLFAIMPVHSEVVASLKNRDILLCFLFCLMAFKRFLLFYESGFRHWPSFVMVLLYFYLAFLSKLDALPFLAIIPVLAFVKNKLHLKQVLLFGGLLFASYLFYTLTKSGVLEKATAKRVYSYFENPLFFNTSFKYRLLAACNSLGFYVVQSVFPVKLCCYYGYDTIPVLRLSWYGWLGIASMPALLYGLIKSYLKKELVVFAGLFIFCASTSMYLNLVRPAVGIVADRFAFMSSLGMAVFVVGILGRYWQTAVVLPVSVKVAAVFVLVISGTRVVLRNTDWKSLDSLMLADYAKYPNNAFLNYLQGLNMVQAVEQKRTRMETMEQQRAVFIKARDLLEKSVSIDPRYLASRTYLCYVYIYLLNDFKTAMPHINKALTQEENKELYFYKAICMRETKQADSAEFYLKKCLELDKLYYNAYNLLSYDYNAKKEYKKTIALYTNAIRQGANTLEINNSLGKTYWEQGDTANAIVYYQFANKLDPLNEESAAMLKRLRKK